MQPRSDPEPVFSANTVPRNTDSGDCKVVPMSQPPRAEHTRVLPSLLPTGFLWTR